MEIQRLHHLLEMGDIRGFEYICLINIRDRSCSVFRNDGENSHLIPESADFDTVVKHIRDTQIPVEQRDSYYENAALDRVLSRMQETSGVYSYRYTTLDGVTREASFRWYENSRTELLMVVRKVEEAVGESGKKR